MLTHVFAPKRRSCFRLALTRASARPRAVLWEIAAHVYTVERLGQLADKAAATLADLGYDNVRVLHGDSPRGWLELTPYHAIVVAADGPQVPESPGRNSRLAAGW
jgi:precorrin-6B methylase 2